MRIHLHLQGIQTVGVEQCSQERLRRQTCGGGHHQRGRPAAPAVVPPKQSQHILLQQYSPVLLPNASAPLIDWLAPAHRWTPWHIRLLSLLVTFHVRQHNASHRAGAYELPGFLNVCPGRQPPPKPLPTVFQKRFKIGFDPGPASYSLAGLHSDAIFITMVPVQTCKESSQNWRLVPAAPLPQSFPSSFISAVLLARSRGIFHLE